jgi:hypothetical protein
MQDDTLAVLPAKPILGTVHPMQGFEAMSITKIPVERA